MESADGKRDVIVATANHPFVEGWNGSVETLTAVLESNATIVDAMDS